MMSSSSKKETETSLLLKPLELVGSGCPVRSPQATVGPFTGLKFHKVVLQHFHVGNSELRDSFFFFLLNPL